MHELVRNEIIATLNGIIDPTVIADLMIGIDQVLNRYDLIPRNNLPAIYEPRDAELRLYLGCKTVEGLSKQSIKRYNYTLGNFVRRMNKPVNEITTNDIRCYLYEYQQQNDIDSRTLDSMRQVISGFFAWCTDEGYISNNPTKAIKPIKYKKKQREHLTRLELEMVRQACKNSRQKAILEFLYSTGCRVSELCQVKLSEVNRSAGSVTLHGKGNKDRTAYINAKCSLALDEYLKERTQESPYLFCTTRAPYGPLTKEIIDREFKATFGELSDRIGKPISPHVIRHTTATLALEADMDVTQIQKLLGHASISTTMIYATVSDENVAEAHKKYIV